jgi:hypothetical protein
MTVGLLAAMASRPLGGQEPQFRAATDLVSVDVSVHQGDVPVRDLTAADFRLTDNGVVQRIEIVEGAAMPVDVTLIVDTSAGTGGGVTGRMSDGEIRNQLRRNVAQMAQLLRPDDHLRLVTSDTYLRQVITATAGVAIDTTMPANLAVLGQASTYDALAAALMLPVGPTRRHLVVAWVKPVDTMSIADEMAVREVARSADAVLHIIERDLFVMRAGSAPIIAPLDARLAAAQSGDATGGSSSAPFGGPAPLPSTPGPITAANLGETDRNETQFHTRSWRPFSRVSPPLLPELAALTGGTHRGTGVLSDFDAAEVFKGIFDTFRQGYVLRYRPQGVRREGRHELLVTVPRYPEATIRARRSYEVESETPANAADSRSTPADRRPNAGAALAVPTSMADLVPLFERGDDDAFRNGVRQAPNLRRFLRDYQTAETPWPAHPRLEALFVVNLAAAGMLSDDEETRDEAVTLLMRHAGLVRHPLGADRFECAWYVAAVSGAQAAYLADVTSSLAGQALERCPNEGRLHLARAIATDQLWSIGAARARISGDAPRNLDITAVLDGYTSAIDRAPAVASEAAVRAAWAAYRARDLQRSLAELQRVTQPGQEPIAIYYRHLIGAQVLRHLDRADDAIASYRAALAAWPAAQAARVGLMTLLVERGDLAGAGMLSEAIQTAPPNQIDPWWVYWVGDYRSFSQQLRNLRELAG